MATAPRIYAQFEQIAGKLTLFVMSYRFVLHFVSSSPQLSNRYVEFLTKKLKFPRIEVAAYDKVMKLIITLDPTVEILQVYWRFQNLRGGPYFEYTDECNIEWNIIINISRK